MLQEERTFLNEEGVQVTNTRLILPNQTFAMSGITSVQSEVDKPSKVGPIVILIIGALLLLGEGESIVLAIIMLVVGGSWFVSLKSTYHILLQTASGEAKALSSNDGDRVSRIVSALNESMVHRG